MTDVNVHEDGGRADVQGLSHDGERYCTGVAMHVMQMRKEILAGSREQNNTLTAILCQYRSVCTLEEQSARTKTARTQGTNHSEKVNDDDRLKVLLRARETGHQKVPEQDETGGPDRCRGETE